MAPKRKILPPVWLLLFVLMVFLVDRVLPLMALPPMLQQLATPLVLAGLLVIGWPALAFVQKKTGLVPFSKATSLVTGGLYRFTRNPMYLGMLMILLGAALKFGSIGALLPVPFFPLVMQQRFIIPEERFLLETFGDEYRAYRQQVRRWL